MTREQNELIRYPVAVDRFCLKRVIDDDRAWVATVRTERGAAEIVRVLNAYHDGDKERKLLHDAIDSLNLELKALRKTTEAQLSSQPAPVAASGEPSEAAMEAANNLCRYYPVLPRSIARIIDTAFAAERAEAAEYKMAAEINWSGWQTAERERDEARGEYKTRNHNYLQAMEHSGNLEQTIAQLRDHINAMEVVHATQRNNLEFAANEIDQLRADLDEAVACIENIDLVRDSREKVKDLLRIYFTSKPSEPGNCSGSSDSSQAAPPETATDSWGAYSGWRDRRDELGRRVRDTWVRWAQDQLYTKPSWVIPYDEISEADKEVDRQIGEDIAVFVELQSQSIIATLRTQLAERDAEIAEWKKRDRIKDEQLKTAGRRARQWRRRCGLAETHRASVIELESALRQEEGLAAEQDVREIIHSSSAQEVV